MSSSFTLPPHLVPQFQEDLRKVTDAGKATLAQRLKGLQFDTATKRNEARILLNMVLDSHISTYADAIATRAAQFFDECAAAQGLNVRPARNVVGFDRKATEVAVKAITNHDKREVVEQQLLNRFDYEMRRISHAVIYENAWEVDDTLRAQEESKQQQKKSQKPAYGYGNRPTSYHRVRFARVPSGRETCDFCVTLASRGFVYHSKDSADLYGHMHANCDCVIVPSFVGAAVAIAGYDPGELYDQYLETRFAPGGSASGRVR